MAKTIKSGNHKANKEGRNTKPGKTKQNETKRWPAAKRQYKMRKTKCRMGTATWPSGTGS